MVSIAAELTGLSPDQVETALRYYADYPDEIDAWIARVDEDAERAKASRIRSEAVLRR